MNESRKQFEEWIRRERPRLFLDHLLQTTQYADPATERLWLAWQASRQALQEKQKGE